MSALLTVGLLGITAAKILLRANDHGDAADVLSDVAEGADLLARHRSARGVVALGRRVTKRLDAALLENPEYRAISPNDHAAVVADITDLIEKRLADPHWMIDAVVEPERLTEDLLEHGGRQQQQSHGKNSEAALLHGILLRAVVEEVARYAPDSPDFAPQALAQLVKDAEAIRAGVDDLIGRPTAGAIYATDAVGYWADIGNLAPAELLDRDNDLAELATFATCNATGDDAWWGYEAKPLAGKTAILTWFALHPPRGVTPIIHAIRSTRADTTTRIGALTALYAQLARVAGRDVVPQPTGTRVDVYRTEALIEEAVACCQALTPPTRLVIIIDGIDEDAYYDTLTGRHDQPSILSALPATLPPGAHVLIARRSNPALPNDLNTGANGAAHPLHSRTVWRVLTDSAHSKDNIDPTTIDDLMRPRGGSDYGYEIAAYLTAAAAPLTISDLTALIQQGRPDARANPVAIQDLINATPGRNLDNALTPLRGRGGFVLGHDTVRARIIECLATTPRPDDSDDDRAAHVAWEHRALAPWRTRIRAWANTYAEQGWPDDTPDYALSSAYRALLQDADGADEGNTLQDLADVLTNPRRIRTIRNIQGTDIATLTQLHETEGWALGRSEFDEDNVYHLARLIHTDEHLTTSAQLIPWALPGIYARLAKPAIATNLANAIPDLGKRVRALAETAQGWTAMGYVDQARIVADQCLLAAADITDDLSRAHAMAGVAQALARAGCVNQAREGAQQGRNALYSAGITAPWDESTLMKGFVEIALGVARALADVGQGDLALDLAMMTPEPENQAGALVRITQALTNGGHVDYAHNAIDLALETINRIDDPIERVASLATTSRSLNDAGYLNEAAQAADRTLSTDLESLEPWRRTRVLTDIAPALVAVGRTDQILAMIRNVNDREERDAVVGSIAQALAQSEHVGISIKMSQDITDLNVQARVLAKAARFLSTDGDKELALKTASRALAASQSAAHPWDRWFSVSETAIALATAGDVEQALSVAGDIADPLVRVSTISGIVHALAAAGNTDQALQVAADIDDLQVRVSATSAVVRALAVVGQVTEAIDAARDIVDLPVRAELLTDMALALTDAGDTAQALRVAEEARNAALAADELQHHEWTLTDIARALAEAGNINHAVHVVEQVLDGTQNFVDPYHQARVLAIIAQVLADIGQADPARRIALEAARALHDLPPAFDWDRGGGRAAVRLQVTRALILSGDIIGTNGVIPAQQDRAQALADAARTRAVAGYNDEARVAADGAISTAVDISDPWSQICTLTDVASTLAGRHPDQAREAASKAADAAESVASARLRALAYARAAQALVDSGSIDEAYRAALMAFYTLPHIPDHDLNAAVPARVARALAAAGADEKALQTARQALGIAARSSSGRESSESDFEAAVLADIVRSIAMAGDPSFAIEAASEIGVPYISAQAFAAAARGAAASRQGGHSQQAALSAYATAQRILDPGLRSRVLADVASALAVGNGNTEAILSAVAASWCASHSLASCWAPLTAVAPDLTGRIASLLAHDQAS